MHLHGLSILHGNVTPVGKTRKRASLYVDAWPPYVQNNILITRAGQACLADFGIAGALEDISLSWYKLGSLRYMAPERFSADISRGIDSLPMIEAPSKQSDIYSLAMTSFEVRPSAASHPTT
jgi:serine/threonine protein kinase